MKHNRIPALLLALLISLTALTGCGSSAGDTTANEQAGAENSPSEELQDAAPEDGFLEGESGEMLPQPPSNAKVIYTGRITLETTDLDASLQGLTSLVDSFGGFFEQRETYNHGEYMQGNYTLRVPGDRFDEFLSAVAKNSAFKLTYQSTSCENVSEAYGDLEHRLETLEIKLGRLQELLAQAKDMEEIITIESSITEVEYEMDRLSGEKRRYDSLIDYSTVYVELYEVSTFSEGVNPTLGERLKSGFQRGISNFGEGMENLLVWTVSNFLSILVFAAVMAIVVTVLVKHRRRKKTKKAQMTQNKSNSGD